MINDIQTPEDCTAREDLPPDGLLPVYQEEKAMDSFSLVSFLSPVRVSGVPEARNPNLMVLAALNPEKAGFHFPTSYTYFFGHI